MRLTRAAAVITSNADGDAEEDAFARWALRIRCASSVFQRIDPHHPLLVALRQQRHEHAGDS